MRWSRATYLNWGLAGHVICPGPTLGHVLLLPCTVKVRRMRTSSQVLTPGHCSCRRSCESLPSQVHTLKVVNPRVLHSSVTTWAQQMGRWWCTCMELLLKLSCHCVCGSASCEGTLMKILMRRSSLLKLLRTTFKRASHLSVPSKSHTCTHPQFKLTGRSTHRPSGSNHPGCRHTFLRPSHGLVYQSSQRVGTRCLRSVTRAWTRRRGLHSPAVPSALHPAPAVKSRNAFMV